MAGSKYEIQVATVDKYSKPLKVMSAAQTKFRQELKSTRAEAKKFSQSEKDIKSFTAVKFDMDVTRTAIKNTRLELKKTGQQISDNGGVMTAKLKKQAESQKKSLNMLTKRYDLQQKKMNALKKVLISATGSIDNLSKSQRLLAAKAAVANRKLGQQAERVERLKRAESYLETRRQRNFEKEKHRLFKLTKLEQELQKARGRRNDKLMSAAAAGAFLLTAKKVINQAADLETAMVEVAKKASFKSASGRDLSKRQQGKQLGKLQDWIVKTAPDIGMNPIELAQIVASGAGANVARAGREQEDLQAFSRLAAKMSVAFDNLSPEQAGKSVATWMASMKLDMSQSAELASAINHLSDNSGAETAAVTELMTRSGSIMLSAGLDFKQAAALSTAILSANGNKSEMGATAAKNMVLTLTMGDAMSGGQKRVLSELGLDPVQLSKDMQRDAVNTIYTLIEKIQQKPQYKRNSIVSTLFGRESIGAINPLINNMKELKRVMAASGDATALRTSLDKEFAIQQATANAQQKRVKDSFIAITSVMANELLPIITAGSEALADAMMAGTEFIQENEEIARVVIRAAAAIAMLKAGMIAWRVAGAAMEVVSLKRKLSETKLGATTTKTATMATRAAAALDRLNASLNRTAAGGFAGGTGAGEDGKSKRKGKRGRGKFARLRALGSKIPVAGTALAAGLGAYALSDTLSSDSQTKGRETGELIGSIGGSMAGAAAGAAFGSLIPIIGTAFGGIIGAIAGEELFSALGIKLGSLFDETPAQIAKAVELSQVGDSSKAQAVNVDGLINRQVASLASSSTVNSSKSSSIVLEYKPHIVFNGDADKQVVDSALGESEERVNDFLSQSLGNQLDASMSDSIPNFR